MDEPAELVCRVPGCGGPVAGVCLNGLSFEECPDVVPAGIGSTPAPAQEEEDERDHVATGLTSGMTVAEADAFLRAHGGTVIATVAGPNVGKTTLIGTFYELAHRGGLPSLSFAGSETISAFEQFCFLSRAASRRAAADTARTPRRGSATFLHLRLAGPNGGAHDLLLSDRSGEDFEEAVDSPDDLAGLDELGRADAILLLIDAERLHSAHQAETARVRRLLVALGHVRVAVGKPVLLVATKLDRLAGDDQRDAVAQRARLLLDEVGKRMPNSRAELHFTACRARPGEAMFGDGVGELLSAAITTIPPAAFETTWWNPGVGGTALDRLMHGVSET